MESNFYTDLANWLPFVIFFVIFIALVRKNRGKYDLMMDRQQEAVELLREIRDVLKNK